MKNRRATGSARYRFWFRLELAIIAGLSILPVAMLAITAVRDVFDTIAPACTALSNTLAAPANSPAGLSPVRFRADRGGGYRTDVSIDGVMVPMLIDTGATHSILSAHDARRVFGPTAGTDAGQVQTMGGLQPLRLYTARQVLIAGHMLADVETGVVSGAALSVVGTNWLHSLGPVIFEPYRLEDSPRVD